MSHDHRMHDIRLYAFIGDCLTAKQNIPDLHTTIGFCCETLHQFWCETFTVITWRTTYDYWFCCETLHQFWCETFTMIARLTTYDHCFFLRNFAPVLVKLLRWLPDWPRTTTGFCCETLHQFWCETFTVIAWLTTYDYWLLLRNFAPVRYEYLISKFALRNCYLSV